MYSQAPRSSFPFGISNRTGMIARGGYNNRFFRRPQTFMDGQQHVPVLQSTATYQNIGSLSSSAEVFTTVAPAEPRVQATTSLVADTTGTASAVSNLQNGTDGGEDMTNDSAKDNNEQQIMANIKEKTPMCLVNELARFNKIQHQYTLTDEQGPAHKKVFFVKLKLGDEEFAATGQSIKKAQHAAAKIALEQTKYRKPPPKSHRPGTTSMHVEPENPSVTPTVELNALAMKRGESASYHPIERPRPVYYPMSTYNFRGIYNQRYAYPRPANRFCILLKVGPREFIGEGATLQAARHQAASLALKTLHDLPLPQAALKAKTKENSDSTDDSTEDEESKDALKSAISLVHEIALKRNFSVNFEVTKESGPPHLRNFITHCTCGHLGVDGEGKSKKLSKKAAADKMLEELGTLSPLPPPPADKPKRTFTKPKQNKTLIKLQKANPDYGAGINPISRLIQIQQAKKEKEPVYSLVADKGAPKFHEFVMQVTVGEKICSGSGPNKKLAKRNAAEQMLQLLGYSRPSPQPTKPAIKMAESNIVVGAGGDKKVTFVDQDQAQSQACQVVPGVIVVPGGSQLSILGQNGSYPREGLSSGQVRMEFSKETAATIVSEVLTTGSSSTAELMMKSGTTTAAGPSEVNSMIAQSPIRPGAQLLYLARILGFQVQFTNFPKGGNKVEYLSLVTLSTNPPQHSHGSGLTIDAANDSAALEALKTLAELGLDGMGCSNNSSIPGESGDGTRRAGNSGTSKSDTPEKPSFSTGTGISGNSLPEQI